MLCLQNSASIQPRTSFRKFLWKGGSQTGVAPLMHDNASWFGNCSFGQNGSLDPAIGGMVRCVDVSKFLATIWSRRSVLMQPWFEPWKGFVSCASRILSMLYSMRVSAFSYVDFFLNGSQFMYSLQSSAFSLFHFIFMWQCCAGHCQIPLPSVRDRFSVLDEDFMRHRSDPIRSWSPTPES